MRAQKELQHVYPFCLLYTGADKSASLYLTQVITFSIPADLFAKLSSNVTETFHAISKTQGFQSPISKHFCHLKQRKFSYHRKCIRNHKKLLDPLTTITLQDETMNLMPNSRHLSQIDDASNLKTIKQFKNCY